MAGAGNKVPVPDRGTSLPRLLATVPHKNTAVKLRRVRDGMLVTIPMTRPRWLVPPLSWILPFSQFRQVRLDAPGTAVLDLCDGQRTIEQIIDTFAGENKLSFREAQLAVVQFFRELVQRGIVALVGTSGRE